MIQIEESVCIFNFRKGGYTMEIFGKRPFVLKTGKMYGKIKAIDEHKYDATVKAVKNKLYCIENHADTYKDAQEAASVIGKTFSDFLKKKFSNEEFSREVVKVIKTLKAPLLTLGFSIEKEDSDNCFFEQTKFEGFKPPKNIPVDFDCSKTSWFNYATKKGARLKTSDLNLFILESKVLEKICREKKQELKNIFEEIYKALKSYIKKLEKASKKGTGQKDINQVVASEIKVFEKYGIPFIKIAESDNLLVKKVKDWLEKVAKHAKTYQNAHEAANNIIRYTQSKKDALVNKELKKLYEAAKEVKKMLDKEQIDGVTCYQDFKGLVDKDKFPENYKVDKANMYAIKKGCQEAQNALLGAYEEVSKSLESYIKKLDEVKKANEKGTDQKDIKQVAKSELDVFEGYNIISGTTFKLKPGQSSSSGDEL